MILIGVKNNKIFRLSLPSTIDGNYIIKDNLGKVLGSVIGNDSWVVYPDSGYSLLCAGKQEQQISIEEGSEFILKDMIDGSEAYIVCSPSVANNAIEVKPNSGKLTIGTNPDCDICYASPLLKQQHAVLSYINEKWYIECVGDALLFVDNRLARRKRINYGDTIYLYGLKIICICDFIVFINCSKVNNLVLKQGVFSERQQFTQNVDANSYSKETSYEIYSPDELFLRSPRFKTYVIHQDIPLALPSDRITQSTQPAILTIGPRITMMLSSFVSLFTVLQSIATGQATFASSLPTILLTGVMIISSLLWPALTRKYNSRETKKAEIKRQRLYRAYLAKKEKDIINIISNQKQILLENNVTLEQCQEIIYNRKRNLWERTLNDKDFLTVRIGTGFLKPDITIDYEEAEFDVQDDILKDEVKALVKKFDYVEEAPLNFSFIDNRITAIVGNYSTLQMFFESIILQMMTFHLYTELKICVFTNEAHVNDWSFIKFLPHCWNNQRERRFIAATSEEKKKLSSYLEAVIKDRKENTYKDGEEEGEKDKNEDVYKKFGTYYLVITDDIANTRNLDAINDILNLQDNLGFSMIIKNDRISNLPSQCSTFLNITDETSGMFGSELNITEQRQFKADLNKNISVEDCAEQAANIFVSIPREKHELPKSIGFLEMYGIGNVQQFNSGERWKNNNPVVSLSVPVGIDQNGELFNMDIHEKAYGPHGLVAGTTGSGKSEWIITYILSLCVNFSPEEVQFVLIDYKGGGLAGSFENKETGIALPHVIGTITNLDKSEIRRSLASLEAESKRRQRMFNEAREKLNDSSMNIYKYQQYYRKGLLTEPLSHLFIISDEFAELKSQEPEFLDQLVSIARIGRSLGIHLILATQKPAGVVTDQMWSNSRFKVCLRVQDKADSQDMLKVPDAAYLHQTGAFYFQVGLNEVFSMGQSAYAGGKYKPTSVLKKNIDTSLDLIDRSGDILDTVDVIEQDDSANSNVHGEELLNIIMYISELSKKQNMNVRKLWLEAIPETIFVDTIKQRYNVSRLPFQVHALIGEYDNPYNQLQGPLVVDMAESNIAVIGPSGSGKEQLLQSMIYSIISNYTPQEVNLYIADYGAETLGMFENAPHVGNVIYSHDKVLLQNLIRFLKKEIKERRNRYKEFGGTYANYIKYSQTKDPLIVSVINGANYIKENYVDIFEDFETIFVDCAKYGIIIVEASVEKNLHRNKVQESFATRFALRSDSSSLEDIMGNGAKGINIKDLKGRGLCDLGNQIFEFQTCMICSEDKMQSSVKAVCTTLNNSYKTKARPIPVIPNPIDTKAFDMANITINNICVGYSKASIAPEYFDLQKNVGTLILGNKKQHIKKFCRIFNEELDVAASKGTKVYFFDPEDIFKSAGYKNITYVNSEEVINTFNNLLIYINGEKDKFTKLENKADYKPKARSLIVLYHTSELYRMIGAKVVQSLTDAFATARELGLFDFVFIDILSDFKDIQREKSIIQSLSDSNGVLISNIYDQQTSLDLSVKDIKVKENLLDNECYIIEKGRAKLGQILQDEPDEVEES